MAPASLLGLQSQCSVLSAWRGKRAGLEESQEGRKGRQNGRGPPLLYWPCPTWVPREMGPHPPPPTLTVEVMDHEVDDGMSLMNVGVCGPSASAVGTHEVSMCQWPWSMDSTGSAAYRSPTVRHQPSSPGTVLPIAAHDKPQHQQQ
ncbi:hypothetical protein CMUS01_00182 [Colletotrichum musicola]|uniref:Uncharacterized protein n=1 Tax=Colletotrichum musicola TaxID=2175873 RepID=A0A8H6UA11_9PEZI|nr:hypothetical protein CMUS01_00182 [Colletotrichum musicola]